MKNIEKMVQKIEKEIKKMKEVEKKDGEQEKKQRRKKRRVMIRTWKKKVGRMEQGNKEEKHHYNRNKYRGRDKRRNDGRMA